MSASRWLSAHLEELTGLSPERNRLRNPRERAHERGGAGGVRLTSELLEQDDVASLIDDVTVNESYFFRDPRQLMMLQREILPRLARARRDPITVWSAGCATGEEPYTVAMVAAELGLLPRVRVLGTDLSAHAIAAARAGRYGAWSLRGVDDGRRWRWFEGLGDLVEPLPAVRARVRFRVANLLDGPPGRFDLVVCRNVLMYLTPEAVRRATDVLASALTDDGWLVTGASDPLLDSDRLHPVRTRLGLVYRRAGAPAVESQPPARTQWGDEGAADPTPRAAPVVRADPGPSPASVAAASLEEPRHDRTEPLATATRLADRGATDEALEVVEQGLEQDPLDAELHLLAAMLHLQHGATDEALGESRRALYLDGSLAVAHMIQGYAFRLGGDHARAASSFDSAARALADLPRDACPPGAGGESAGHLASSAGRLAAAERS